MTPPLHIVGGVYRERCQWPMPETDQVFGSAGRAAAALHGTGIERILHTYVGPDLKANIELILGAFDIQIDMHERAIDPVFDYAHCLAIPAISPELATIRQEPSIQLIADHVVRFGMLEGDARVQAHTCVYDPQSAYAPLSFRANGSSASRLAIVANSGELHVMTGERDPERAAQLLREAERADVVIAKCGLDGAVVVTDAGTEHVPAFAIGAAHTIGSGDVFVAAFAKFWMYDSLKPAAAAMAASKSTANYIETSVLPVDLTDRQRVETSRSTLRIYLAGPFFTMAQRWQVEEARRVMEGLGLVVFSPLHDVGRGAAPEVVPKDISAIKECDALFAIVDGLDSGTVFEVGFARALGKPVFVFAQQVSDQDLKMMVGSDCIVSDDFASLIVRIAQKS